MSKPGKAGKSAARGERLAAALRENLKRRKEQARNRDRNSDVNRDIKSDTKSELARSPAPGEDLAAKVTPLETPAPEFRRNRVRE
jgi:hypothetical protein